MLRREKGKAMSRSQVWPCSAQLVSICVEFELFLGRGYLPEPFRQITSYLPELFWQIVSYLPEPFRQITTYLPEPFSTKKFQE